MTTIKPKHLMGEMLKFNLISKYNALLSPTPLSEYRAFAKITNDTKPQTLTLNSYLEEDGLWLRTNPHHSDS